jgi:hypothetical protein
MFRSSVRSLAILFGAALTLAACDDSPTTLDPSSAAMAALAGEYAASGSLGAISLTTEEDGETIDWLAAGASVQLRLTADGKTTGRLFIPGGDEDGGDMDEDLAGSWTLESNTVHLDHESDTFIRDMPFRVEGARLVGDESFDGVRVRMELARR